MNFDSVLAESKKIYKDAFELFTPYSVGLALSGGDDSRLAQEVCRHLGIKLDFIIHCNTRTGIPEATEFVRTIALTTEGATYLEADAGSSYEDYVLRKGFFGKGRDAHTLAYHVLKAQHFRKTISANIRQKQRNRNVLILNGVRIDESDNRADNFADETWRKDPAAKSNIWVNIIHYWTTHERDVFLKDNQCLRSPVSIVLGRSGECMCGSMQDMGDRLIASTAFPHWGAYIDSLEAQVVQKFPWRWGENINKYHLQEASGQMTMFPDFMPMCTGCQSIDRKKQDR